MKLPSLILILLCGCSTPNLPNLQLIYPSMTCSGKPTVEGWRLLKAIGATNVVCLATASEVPDPPAGFTMHRFPLNTWQQCFGPVAAQIDAAAAAITEHTATICRHGKNRSRAAVIAWRVRSCGWSKKDAVNEAAEYGWWSSFPALLKYVGKMK
jgi:hypothetical protein